MSEEVILDKIPANYTGSVLEKARDLKKKVRDARHFRIRCCVPGCSSRDNVKGISFHRIPKIRKINKLWKIKCRLVDEIPSTYAVCSKHFLTSDYTAGEYRHIMRNKMLLKTAVPSQNLPVASHSRRRNTVQNENRAQRLLKRNANLSTDNSKDGGMIVNKPNASKKLAASNRGKKSTVVVKSEPTEQPDISNGKTTAEKSASMVDNVTSRVNAMDFLKTRNKLNAWTGIQTFSLLRKIEERVSAIHPKIDERVELTLLECILLCFIRLKTKLSFICLTSIFHISTSTASKIYCSMLPFIKRALDDVGHFSSTIESNDNQLIPLLMYGYNEARAVVYCTDEDVQNSKSNDSRLLQSEIHASKPIQTDLCSSMLDSSSAKGESTDNLSTCKSAYCEFFVKEEV